MHDSVYYYCNIPAATVDSSPVRISPSLLYDPLGVTHGDRTRVLATARDDLGDDDRDGLPRDDVLPRIGIGGVDDLSPGDGGADDNRCPAHRGLLLDVTRPLTPSGAVSPEWCNHARVWAPRHLRDRTHPVAQPSTPGVRTRRTGAVGLDPVQILPGGELGRVRRRLRRTADRRSTHWHGRWIEWSSDEVFQNSLTAASGRIPDHHRQMVHEVSK